VIVVERYSGRVYYNLICGRARIMLYLNIIYVSGVVLA
jgi:hypothetical protein